jgi:exodeoxyribonuclease VII large subunit
MAESAGLPFDDIRHPTRPLTVSELTAELRQCIEATFDTVAVEGEISNCRQWSSGHLYFTLKDDRAQLRAVMFRTTVRTLRFKPEDGMRVIARGRLSVYDAKGDYQIICDALDPHGLGALQAAFEQLKRRLHAEGLFDSGRKRPLPVLPRRIGIVTSADGAALRDILRILTTRHPCARVVIRSARVQGEGAADDLIRSLRAIARVPEIDVVIIGRGGGSAEDLSAFNDERLARAIAASPVPVISAVGHEVDITIADLVADVRAATPSNAAELVVDRADIFRRRIETAHARLRTTMRLRLARSRATSMHLHTRLERWPTTVVLRDRDCRQLRVRLDRAMALSIGRLDARWDAVRRRLEARDLRRVAAGLRTRLVAADGRLQALIAARQAAAGARLGRAAGRLEALSPLGVLQRGYALCWNATRDGIIRSSRAVNVGDAVHVTLAEGELTCRVDAAHIRE